MGQDSDSMTAQAEHFIGRVVPGVLSLGGPIVAHLEIIRL